MTTLLEVWEIQAEQQRALGLEPESMSHVQIQHEMNALLLLLSEETSELARVVGTYKRHILSGTWQRNLIPEAAADVLKTLMAISQLSGISCADLIKAFHEKTELIAVKARSARQALSEHTKLICVDLDDVTFDLGDLRERFGISEQSPTLVGPEAIRVLEGLKNEFYLSDGFRRLEPVAGAVQALAALRELKFLIVFVSARPQWQHKGIHADTLHSLKSHNVPFDLLLFSRNKVEAICEHLAPAWPRFFVEDHERNALDLARAGINVLLFDRPWNSKIPDGPVPGGGNIRRVGGWQEILDIVNGEERKTQ